MPEIRRLGFGNWIDELIQGGIPEQSLVTLVGDPGTGKSILSLTFAANQVKQGIPVLYITTEQRDVDLLIQASTIKGLDVLEKEVGRTFFIASTIFKSRELGDASIFLKNGDVFEVINTIKDFTQSFGSGVVIIDSVTYLWADKPAMSRKFARELKRALAYNGHTCLATSQVSSMTGEAFGLGIEYMADGIIKMRLDTRAKEIRYYMLVEKMRFTNHYKKWVQYDITEEGVVRKE